jgi:hypothetical protein
VSPPSARHRRRGRPVHAVAVATLVVRIAAGHDAPVPGERTVVGTDGDGDGADERRNGEGDEPDANRSILSRQQNVDLYL